MEEPMEKVVTPQKSDTSSSVETIMECCQKDAQYESLIVTMMQQGMKSVSSILVRFDAHFKRTYSWFSGSVTFGCSGEGFGFLLYDHPDASEILKATHIINGKKVAIGRILFVGDLPENTKAEELRECFSKHGNVEDYEIALEFLGGEQANFGFVVFDSEEVVDKLSAMGKTNFCGGQVVLKKAKLLRCLEDTGGRPAPKDTWIKFDKPNFAPPDCFCEPVDYDDIYFMDYMLAPFLGCWMEPSSGASRSKPERKRDREDLEEEASRAFEFLSKRRRERGSSELVSKEEIMESIILTRELEDAIEYGTD